jgi:hypothetical protein
MVGMADVEVIYLFSPLWYQLKRLVTSEDCHYENECEYNGHVTEGG